MKMKSGYMLREVGGEHIVVPVGSRTVDLRGIIRLNATAAFLWEQLKNEIEEPALVEALLEEFDVDRDTAAGDVEKFVASLRENNLLEEQGE